jgi:mannose-6-phosphate isomerase-like protein (cupin superfamily)
MRNLVLLVLGLLTLPTAPASAQANPASEYYSRAQLQDAVAGAATAPSRMAGKLLGNRGSYTYILLRREQSSEAELHDAWDDLMLIQEGSATLLYGGVLSGARQTAPGEHRGGEITAGTQQTISAGDLILLPAGVPHQVLLAPGESVTYLLIKVQPRSDTAQP